MIKDESETANKNPSQFKGLKPGIAKQIEIISDHLKNQNTTLESFHKTLDYNQDGSVDKQEFVDGISAMIKNVGISK
jgi:hypothetical protein